MEKTELPVHPQAEAPERPHAERSASQLKSLALCPGFKPDKKPKKEQHWVTQQGIRGHKALEDDDKGELQSDYEGKLVQLCEDYCNTLPATVLGGVVREPKLDTIEGRWGYADQLRFRLEESEVNFADKSVVATIADIVDYKFVKVKEPEDAEINLQGMDYVVGAFDQYPHVETIHVHFLAPRFGSVTTATFHRSDVPRLKLEIFAILTQAKRTDKKRFPASMLRPHYETCRFCDRAPTCSALKAIAKTIYYRYEADGSTTPLPDVPADVHASSNNNPDELGAMKLLGTVMTAWAEAVNHHTLTKALDEGIVPTGYAIGHKKGKREILLPLALLTIGPKFGLSLADVLECAKISPAQLEDIVREKAPNGQKKHRQGEFIDALTDADALGRGDESPTLIKINTKKNEPTE